MTARRTRSRSRSHSRRRSARHTFRGRMHAARLNVRTARWVGRGVLRMWLVRPAHRR